MSPDPFATDILELEARLDALRPLPDHPIVFYGSSSIRLWTSLRDDFPTLPVINAGFGGSTLEACVRHFDHIVPPLAPRAILLYAGDNDISDGHPPAKVLASFQAFMEKAAPLATRGVRVTYISIKSSPARWHLQSRILEVNALIRQHLEHTHQARFVDINTPMLNPAGGLRHEFYCADTLHLSPAGYTLWRGILQSHASEIF